MVGECAAKGRDRFLGFYEDIRARIGPEVRDYKTLEVDRLDRAFDTILRSRRAGASFVVLMVHRLSWDQALPNVNHRTTLAFVHAMLEENGVTPPWVEGNDLHREAAEAWMRASKRLMADREMWLEGSAAWNELEGQQLVATTKWIKAEDQSGSLAMVSPHFLRNFLSCSVK